MLLHLKWRVDSHLNAHSHWHLFSPFWMQPALQEWMVWNELGCWFLEDLNQDQMVVVLNQEMVSQGKQREGMGADCLNLKADSAWMF